MIMQNSKMKQKNPKLFNKNLKLNHFIPKFNIDHTKISFLNNFYSFIHRYTFKQYKKKRKRKMGKIMKAGRVVLTLGGRYAGRKAIVVKVINSIFKNQKKTTKNSQ